MKNKEHKQIMDGLRGLFEKKGTLPAVFVAVFVLAVLFSLFLSPQLQRGSVHEGDISLKDVYAPYDFSYGWGEDVEATKRSMERAVENIPYLLYRDAEREEEVISYLEGIFNRIEALELSDMSANEKLNMLSEEVPEGLSWRNLRVLMGIEDVNTVADKVFSITEKIFLLGYAEGSDIERLEGENADNIVIHDRIGGIEFSRKSDDLLDMSGAEKLIDVYTMEEFPSDRRIREAVKQLLNLVLGPNLVLDEKSSILEREKILRNIKPVLQQRTVKKDELIIKKGERINARHIAQMSEIRRFFRPGKSLKFFFGVLLLIFLLGLIAVIYKSSVQRKNFLSTPKELGIMLINMFFLIVIADIVTRAPQPGYFIPMAGAGMLVTLLIGFNAAFITVILTSLWVSLLAGGRVELAFAMIVASVAGMFVVRGARRRGNILWAGLFAGTAKFLAIVCVGLVNGMENEVIVYEGLWGLASGIFSGFIVMCLLPLYEFFFKVPTNISLLELSDMNHPLLKRLAMEAPGTYHHSIMVGNLAEAACEAIGANSLLARVGAYYHDIGKISKAEYFSENEMGAKSKHEKLTPQMSTLIIANHVKEGVELAKKHKLNNSIIDFITQHHGDSLIAYFYQKALEKDETGQAVDQANFRYPGPRPQTRETAIVLMADSVEASSRSLEDPTPASISNLVKKIVNNKFIDGQLDECDITLRNVDKIARSFVRVLMGVFHTRLKYPEDQKKDSGDNGNKGKNGRSSAVQEGNEKNDRSVHTKFKRKKKS